MKNLKHIVAIFISIAMLFSIMSFSAYAAVVTADEAAAVASTDLTADNRILGKLYSDTTTVAPGDTFDIALNLYGEKDSAQALNVGMVITSIAYDTTKFTMSYSATKSSVRYLDNETDEFVYYGLNPSEFVADNGSGKAILGNLGSSYKVIPSSDFAVLNVKVAEDVADGEYTFVVTEIAAATPDSSAVINTTPYTLTIKVASDVLATMDPETEEPETPTEAPIEVPSTETPITTEGIVDLGIDYTAGTTIETWDIVSLAMAKGLDITKADKVTVEYTIGADRTLSGMGYLDLVSGVADTGYANELKDTRFIGTRINGMWLQVDLADCAAMMSGIIETENLWLNCAGKFDGITPTTVAITIDYINKEITVNTEGSRELQDKATKKFAGFPTNFTRDMLNLILYPGTITSTVTISDVKVTAGVPDSELSTILATDISPNDLLVPELNPSNYTVVAGETFKLAMKLHGKNNIEQALNVGQAITSIAYDTSMFTMEYNASKSDVRYMDENTEEYVYYGLNPNEFVADNGNGKAILGDLVSPYRIIPSLDFAVLDIKVAENTPEGLYTFTVTEVAALTPDNQVIINKEPCVIGINVVSAPENAAVEVGSVSGEKGMEVTVPVRITNNQGIAGFKFRVNYDKTKLTPVDITSGEILTDSITSNIHEDGIDVSQLDYVTAVWSSESDITDDGELFNITFKISDSVEIGESIPVSITYEDNAVVNQKLEPMELNITDGEILIEQLMYGDIYKDGAVNSKDIVRLRQYLALWDIELLEYELKAADVYKDGATDNKDLVRLSQYLAEWDVNLGE